MDSCEITEKDFVSFLTSLGVNTYGLSFEWMLNDPYLSGVLSWLFNHLDNNNVLSKEENCSYTEILQHNSLLSPDELESTINGFSVNYKGINLPGDIEGIHKTKMEISFCKERLHYLEKQEDCLKSLIKQLAVNELSVEISELNELVLRSKVEENSIAHSCISLAEDVEESTEVLLTAVASTLYALYANVHIDKAISKQFLSFGPFEAYKQSQRLFKSHYNLYTSRKFSAKKYHIFQERTYHNIIVAKQIEKRIYDEICSYIDSVAEVNVVHKLLEFLVNYEDVHPIHIPIRMTECLSAKELLEQDQHILEQRIRDAVMHFAENRTRLVVTSGARAALKQREEIYDALCHLHDLVKTALNLDNLLYWVLHREAQCTEELLQFSVDVKEYVFKEESAVRKRIELMNDICENQAKCEINFEDKNYLLKILCEAYGTEPSQGFNGVENGAVEVSSSLAVLKEEVENIFQEKENWLKDWKDSCLPLKEYIWNGRTKRPVCLDHKLTLLHHSVKEKIRAVEERVIQDSSLFTTVKNGDKDGTRKLWQWFLTDPEKLSAKIDEMKNRMDPRRPFK